MMMYGKARIATEDDSVAATLKSAKYQIAISSNMIVTIVAVFGMVYYASTKIGYHKTQVGAAYGCLSLYADDWRQAMAFGLVGSIVMLAVEMILYIIRTIKMEDYAARSLRNPNVDFKINEK